MAAKWIDEFADIEIDGGVVHVLGISDGEPVTIRCKRSVYRKYIEKARRILDAADRDDQIKIAELRRSG